MDIRIANSRTQPRWSRAAANHRTAFR